VGSIVKQGSIAMIKRYHQTVLLRFMPGLLLAMAAAIQAFAQAPVFKEQEGVWEFRVPSEYDGGDGVVHALLPDTLEPGKTYPVMYILPVERKIDGTFGNGIQEARKADLANRFDIICVYPVFGKVPWYANHPTDPSIRQEDHLIKAVIPFVEKTWPVIQDKEARWLLGFSKSGWGAYNLLFRHPDVFGYAAAWDVPFMIDGEDPKDWGPMGIKHVMGTKEHFQANYVPTKLATAARDRLTDKTRLVLGLGKFWAGQTRKMDAHLTQLGIPHSYLTEYLGKHHWESGWFPPVAEELIRVARE